MLFVIIVRMKYLVRVTSVGMYLNLILIDWFYNDLLN